MSTANAVTSTDILITYNGKLLQNWKTITITRSCQGVPSTCNISVTTLYPGTRPILYFYNDFVIVKAGGQVVFTGFVDEAKYDVTPNSHEIGLSCRSKLADLVDGSNLLLVNTVQAPSIAALAQQLVDKHNSMVTNDAYKIKVVNKASSAGVPIPPVPLEQTATSYEIIEFYARYAQQISYDDVNGDLVLATAGQTRASGSFNLGGNVQQLSFSTSAKERYSDYYAVWSSALAWQDKGLMPPNITGTATDPIMKSSGRFRPLVFVANQFDYNTGEDLSKKRALWEAKSRYGRSINLKITIDTWLDGDGKLLDVNTLIKSQIFPILGTSSNVTDWIIASITYAKSLSTGTTAELTLFPPDAFTPEPIGLNNPYRDIIGGNTGNNEPPPNAGAGGTASGTANVQPATPGVAGTGASASGSANLQTQGGSLQTPPTTYTGF